MKKIYLSFLFAVLLYPLRAQISEVDLNIIGNFEITIKFDKGYVILSDWGELLEISMDGERQYYPDDVFTNKGLIGKIKKIGNTSFSYYPDDVFTNDALKEKVKQIGSISFSYYPDDVFTNEAFRGKVKKIGNTSFTYYPSDVFTNKALAGKVKQIGNTTLSYYPDDNFTNEAFKGKIKQVGTTSLSYYDTFSNKALIGKLNTRNPNYSSDRITFRVHDIKTEKKRRRRR